jgi:Zn-dependent membrane protease YugP
MLNEGPDHVYSSAEAIAKMKHLLNANGIDDVRVETTNGNHLRLTFRHDGREKHIITSSTPSDRFALNERAGTSAANTT